MKRRALPINPNRNGWDQLCLKLARKGIAASRIAAETRLSVYQVRGRLSKYGVSLQAYRNGVGSDYETMVRQLKQSLRDLGRALKAPY